MVADCIVIPGHRSYPDGTCAPSLRARTLNAVGLYRQGLSSVLLFTGGAGQAEAGARLAIAEGVAAEHVLCEARSRTTWENFCFASQLMRLRGLRSCLVSTEPYHILRSCMVARRMGLVAHAAPAKDSPGMRWPWRAWFTVRECFSVLSYLVGIGPAAGHEPVG